MPVPVPSIAFGRIRAWRCTVEAAPSGGSPNKGDDSTMSDQSANGWNYADIFEAVAARCPDLPCQTQGERVGTWREFDRRANAFAADLLAHGITRRAEGPTGQPKLAVYLYNGP